MKERPILFSAPMVRAILNGKKTQTRRVVKPQPTLEHVLRGWVKSSRPKGHEGKTIFAKHDGTFFQDHLYVRCPYGDIGDRLWVRETWQGPLLEDSETNPAIDWYGPSHIEKYKSPAHCVYRADEVPTPEYVDIEDNLCHGWKPSIHTPRWASRILLEITNVRLERLQDISEEDALAEGWPRRNLVSLGPQVHKDAARDWFADLWESIHGLDSWYENPWVWVIEFKVIS